MKQRSKIIIIVAASVLLTITHGVTYACGILRYYRIDFCKYETELMPIELATNSQFMAACETIRMRNTTNQDAVYDAATICIPVLSDFLRTHPDGLHFSVISSLFSLKMGSSDLFVSLFLKSDDAYIYYIDFGFGRYFHINTVSIQMGIQ